MGAPDPDAIQDVCNDGGRWSVWFHHRCGPSVFWPFESSVGGNERRNRENRAKAILRRVMRDGWQCTFCGEEIGFHKRADALYCRERCKRAAARARRRLRSP